MRFGGHSQAAGLSLELKKLDKFTKAIENYCDIFISDEYEEKIYVDEKLPFSFINEELFEALKLGEPYGEAFSIPKFSVKRWI